MRTVTRVSAIAVLDLHDVLLELGVVTLAQMSAAGVQRTALIDHNLDAPPIQEQRLDEALLLALWQLAASNQQVPHVGLVVGQTFNPNTRGVLANWLFQCNQVGDALDVFQNHIALMNPSESWTVSEVDDNLELQICFSAEKSYPQAAIERSMSALLKWSQEMTGVTVIPLACEFSFPRPAYHARYTEIFGDNLRFSSTKNSLHLPRTFLLRPIRNANSYFKQIIEERARLTFAQLQVESELLNKVRQLIQSNLQAGASIEPICQALHISRPTLYRRLKQEGTSFTEQVGEVRKTLAAKLMQQGLAVAVISDQLGFKDVSTFHRAYKRWFNQSPAIARAK